MSGPDARRVLIVDDEADIRSSLATLLPLIAGEIEVDTADDGMAALELLDAGRHYDLIISDQRMPRMTGLDFLTEARRLRPTTPCLLFTAYGHDLDAVRDDLKQLVEAVISKATDVEQMQSIIMDALHGTASKAAA